MTFKIAYCAGHYIGTAGKRVPKELDPNQTREWTLNDRVADHFARAALEYEGVEIMRTDDSTGKTHISIKNRTKKANEWGADIYLDLHHNAGISLGNGGGITVISKPGDEEGAQLRNEIYDAMIAAGCPKGNRSQPLRAKSYNTNKYAKMTAIIIENGFMDSRTDYPIISAESHAKLTGYAIMKGIAKHYGLKKKTESTVEPSPETKTKELPITGIWDRELTLRLQEIFGTTQDGEVSNQYECYKKDNPGLTTGWDWHKKPNGKGSQLIKAMQKWAGLGSNCNGQWGPKTCKAVQKKLGTQVTGKVGNPSMMVRALQRFANSKLTG